MGIKLFMAVSGIVAILLSGCNGIIRVSSSGESPEISRKILIEAPFDGVITQCYADIDYIDGPAEIILSAPESIIDYLEVKVMEGNLVISEKKGKDGKGFFDGLVMGMNSDVNVKLTVSYPGVNSFITKGSGDIKIARVESDAVAITGMGSGDVECREILSRNLILMTQGSGDIEIEKAVFGSGEMTTQGSGDIEVDGISAERLVATSRGSGDITLSGKCGSAELNVGGSGDIDVNSLSCDDAKITRRGSGDVTGKL